MSLILQPASRPPLLPLPLASSKSSKKNHPKRPDHRDERVTSALLTAHPSVQSPYPSLIMPPSISPFKRLPPPQILPDVTFQSGARYRIKSKLGAGKYGMVYLGSLVAQERLPPKNIAIKISYPRSECYLAQTNEEKIVQELNNPLQQHVISFLEGYSNNTMRYTAYELLLSCLHQQRVAHPTGYSLKEVRIFAVQLLNILAYLLSHKVIHGDIKPDNILFTQVNPPKMRLIDFGSARIGIEPLVQTIQALPYRAPEVAMELPHNQTADIWSVGCILAELYTGSLLFRIKTTQDRDTDNRNTLLMIRQTVGPIPQEMLCESRVCQNDSFLRKINIPNKHPLKYFLAKTKKPAAKEPGANQKEELENPEEEAFFDLMEHILTIDPFKRISAQDALKHPFIQEFSPPAKLPLEAPFLDASENKEPELT